MSSASSTATRASGPIQALGGTRSGESALTLSSITAKTNTIMIAPA